MYPIPPGVDVKAANRATRKLDRAMDTADLPLELEAYTDLATVALAGSADRKMWAQAASKLRAAMERIRADNERQRREAAEEREASRRVRPRSNENQPRPQATPTATAAADPGMQWPLGSGSPQAQRQKPAAGVLLPALSTAAGLPDHKAAAAANFAEAIAAAAAAEAAPQSSQPSQSPEDRLFEEAHMCSVCLDLLCEPATASCGSILYISIYLSIYVYIMYLSIHLYVYVYICINIAICVCV